MDDRYRIFAAVEPGTGMEDFMDHMCRTPYVKDSDYAYGEDYSIPEAIFYVLYAKNRDDAGMIARCIRFTPKMRLWDGKLYRVSVGGPGTDLDEFVLRCTAERNAS